MSQGNPEFVICPSCSDGRRYKGNKGLNIHISRVHKPTNISVSNTQTTPSAGPTLSPIDNNNFLKTLSDYRKTIPVLKRIPRGARLSVAQKFVNCLEECIKNNNFTSWKNLLTFAYSTLHVYNNKSKSISLTNHIKQNCLQHQIPDHYSTQKYSYNNIRHIENKFYDGDVKGACRLLFSSDVRANVSDETLEALRSKHPPPPLNECFPEPPFPTNTNIFNATINNVNLAISSFPAGSSSGLDGLTPQHLKDMISIATGETGFKVLITLTKFSNFLLTEKVCPEIVPIFFGASLCALNKKDGGIRPIAIGCTLRRMVSKIISRYLLNPLGSKLSPIQLGFGTKYGCEAAVHATRTFLMKNKSDILLKIDIKNAFNTLYRENMLTAVLNQFPEVYPYIFQCYASQTCLIFDGNLINSSVGCQQGDPLGPALFSLTIHDIISNLNSSLNIWYLDDGTLGGKALDVLNDLEMIINQFKNIGLELNSAKCEIYINNDVPNNDKLNLIEKLNILAPNIKYTSEKDLFLLGAPIFDNAIPPLIEQKQNLFKQHILKLSKIHIHIAIHLIRYCLYVPTFTYLIRCSPFWKYQNLTSTLDLELKTTLETIFNITFENDSWDQATLPVSSGGLGIRKISSITLPAFIASVSASNTLIGKILNPSLGCDFEVLDKDEAINVWKSIVPSSDLPINQHIQKQWDQPIINDNLNTLLRNASDNDKARLLAVTAPESGAWLQAFPAPSIGTLLDNNTVRIAICLRIGAKLCESHICPCGSGVDEYGLHGLACKLSAGRIPRHANINNIIRRSLATISIPSILEPRGISRSDGKRPDGMTLVPWKRGRALVWDATCVDTMAPSHIQGTSCRVGSAAATAEANKRLKYNNIFNNYEFVAFAVETMGPWSKDAQSFYNTLAPMLKDYTGDSRSGAYFKQQISLAIQRGNAASVLGTMPMDRYEEYFVL